LSLTKKYHKKYFPDWSPEQIKNYTATSSLNSVKFAGFVDGYGIAQSENKLELILLRSQLQYLTKCTCAERQARLEKKWGSGARADTCPGCINKEKLESPN